MRARGIRVVAGLLAVLLGSPVTDAWAADPAARTAGAAANRAPAVAPSLREWTGGTGEFRLTASSRVVAAAGSLAEEAGTLAADLGQLTGRRLPVVSSARALPGDIVLRQDAGAPAHPEGYVLEIADSITLRARQTVGISRGAQTVQQLFALDDLRVAVPRGTATDWPTEDERGFMLDLGRKYYQPAYVEQQIRTAAWYKLNTVHLHLTEWNAFRLDSPRFPGLAAEESYTEADIARFEAVARKYQVTILPEIDLPAHATAITSYWPETVWDCEPMNSERGRNFTIDVTKPRSREVVKQLLDEFVPWFSGPRFHIGTDEYPYKATQERCPELVEYAARNGFANTDDVMVGFIDYMNSVVRSHGRTAQAWGWWDAAGDPTSGPSKDIVVEAYGDDVFADGTAGARHFLEQGYQVVYADGNDLYVTPGLDLLPDNGALYADWPTVDHPNLRGHLMSRWSDERETAPDLYHDWYAHRALQVLADRSWGGPPRSGHLAYQDDVDRIGPPPGVTQGYPAASADTVQLRGEPYGSSPPFSPDSGYDRAFDGDPATFFDYSRPDGAYAGLDLGTATRLAKVRILPRSGSGSHLGRMTGGRIQGCTRGPADGCTDLATVTWQPPGYDWVQLQVHDPGSYRWLRYVSPDGGFGNVAEIEFHAPPSRDVSVAVQAPSTLRPLQRATVRAVITNTGDGPVTGLDTALLVEPVGGGERLAAHPVGRHPSWLRPGETSTVAWSLDLPLDVSAGEYRLTATAGWRSSPDSSSGLLRTGASRTADVVSAAGIALTPARLAVPAGESGTTRLAITNQAAATVDVAWRADAPADDAVAVEPGVGSARLAPGETRSWTVTVRAGAREAAVVEVPIRVRATHRNGSADLPPVTLSVTDGTLYLDGTNLLSAAGADWTDYDYSFTATPYQTGHGGQYAQAGWFFRAQDTGNGYAWLIGNVDHPGAPDGNLTKVIYRDGGYASVQVVPLPMKIVAGQQYRIRTSLRGNTITTYVDGTLVDTTENTSWSSGRIGFRQDPGESARFDDVRVTAPDGTVLFADDFAGDLSGWRAG